VPELLPRPSKLLATVSVLVISGNLLLISAFIAASVVELNPFAMIGGLMSVVPLCIIIAVQQYRGTFCRVPFAARTTSVFLYVVGGFMLLALVVSAGMAIVNGIALRRMASTLVSMSLIAVFSFVVGRMNASWCRKLRSTINSVVKSPVHGGISLPKFLLGVIILAAMTGITLLLIRYAPPRYAEHIESADAPFSLPAQARDVSYCRGSRGTIAYEFTVDEPIFREWFNSGIGSVESESAGIPLKEIVSPFTITRYNALSPELSGPDAISVTIGLYYSWSKEDRGVYAVFDRTTNRAYYYAHFH
jgi:hypothetical protein